MPINIPGGKSIAIASMIRTGVVEEANAVMAYGVIIPNTNKLIQRNNKRAPAERFGDMNFDVVKLPMPPDSNSVNRTTDKA